MNVPNDASAEDILMLLRTQDIQLRERVQNVLRLQRGDPNRMEQARERAMELSRIAEAVGALQICFFLSRLIRFTCHLAPGRLRCWRIWCLPNSYARNCEAA